MILQFIKAIKITAGKLKKKKKWHAAWRQQICQIQPASLFEHMRKKNKTFPCFWLLRCDPWFGS